MTYKIYVERVQDFEPIINFFQTQNIKFDYLPGVNGIERITEDSLPAEQKPPLIDMLDLEAEKTFIICDIGIVKTFLLQKSRYKNIKNLIESGKVHLIQYNHTDMTMFFYHPTEHIPSEIMEDFRQLPIDVMGPGNLGSKIRTLYKNKTWTQLPDGWINMPHPNHFSNVLDRKQIDNSFFVYINLKNEKKHREDFLKMLQDRAYSKNAWIKVNDKTQNIYEAGKLADIYDIYGSDWHFFDVMTPVRERYEKSYFEIVPLSWGHHDHDDTFDINEKLLKPISMKHPFLVVGAYHSLKHLKERGFKTFDSLIDESYDNEPTLSKRLQKIDELLSKLDAKKFYNESRDICEYNFNHYCWWVGYYQTDLWQTFNNFFTDLFKNHKI